MRNPPAGVFSAGVGRETYLPNPFGHSLPYVFKSKGDKPDTTQVQRRVKIAVHLVAAAAPIGVR